MRLLARLRRPGGATAAPRVGRHRRAVAAKDGPGNRAAALAELGLSLDGLRAEIDRLAEANRAGRSLQTERRLLRLRHLAGIRLLDAAPETAQFASADVRALPARAASNGNSLPEFRPQQLTPGALRAAILRDGCALVRGLVPRRKATRLAALIDRAFAERERLEAGETPAEGYYEEFEPEPRFEAPGRSWIRVGGGLLAADSPMVCFAVLEAFAAAGVGELVSGYLGEPGLISLHKTTLRRAEPSVPGAWHQDGFFMGPVRSVNLWLSLSRCGDVAPGLDVLPRRLEGYIATGTEGTKLSWTISEAEVERAAAGGAVSRPTFDPGDALLFDELFLHKTAAEDSMPEARFAVESWFFGGSLFPRQYAPLLV